MIFFLFSRHRCKTGVLQFVFFNAHGRGLLLPFTFLKRKVKPKNSAIKGGGSAFCNIIFLQKQPPFLISAGDKPPPYDGSGVCEKNQPYAKIIFYNISSSALYLFYAYFPKNKRTRYIKKSKFFAPLSFKKADGERGSAPMYAKKQRGLLRAVKISVSAIASCDSGHIEIYIVILVIVIIVVII